MQEFRKYRYNGPVFEFNTCIAQHWEGETMAPTESKAKSNLAYQFKREFHRTPNSKITLTGQLEILDRKENNHG